MASGTREPVIWQYGEIYIVAFDPPTELHGQGRIFNSRTGELSRQRSIGSIVGHLGGNGDYVEVSGDDVPPSLRARLAELD